MVNVFELFGRWNVWSKNNNDNNNSQTYIANSMSQDFRGASLGAVHGARWSTTWWRQLWPANHSRRLYTIIPTTIITQPEGWYSFRRITEGSRLSRPRHYRQGCCGPCPKTTVHNECGLSVCSGEVWTLDTLMSMCKRTKPAPLTTLKRWRTTRCRNACSPCSEWIRHSSD